VLGWLARLARLRFLVLPFPSYSSLLVQVAVLLVLVLVRLMVLWSCGISPGGYISRPMAQPVRRAPTTEDRNAGTIRIIRTISKRARSPALIDMLPSAQTYTLPALCRQKQYKIQSHGVKSKGKKCPQRKMDSNKTFLQPTMQAALLPE
jgi:hypothetical protein